MISADEKAPPNGQRIHGLDALRGVLMMLGVLLHSALAYMSPTEWPFKDNIAQSDLLHFLTDGIHLFRMPAFFVISGFFGALLWQRRGPRAAIKNRIQRIVLPFGAFIVVLYPITFATFEFGGRAAHGEAEPALTALVQSLDEHLLPGGTLHLWFLYDLILISVVIMAFVALMNRLDLRWTRLLGALRRLFEHPWAFFVVLTTLNAMWAMVHGWTSIPTEGAWIPENLWLIAYYLLWYGLGWMIYASGTVLKTFERWAGTLVGIGFLATLARFVVAQQFIRDGLGDGQLGRSVAGVIDALPPQGAEFWMYYWTITSSVVLVAYTRGLTGLFLRYAGHGSARWRYLSDSSYWVYLIHLPLTVVVPTLLWGWDVPVGIKYVTAVAITAGICWMTYDCVVRSTWIGRFLNGRTYPARARRWSTAGSIMAVGAVVLGALNYPAPTDRPSPWPQAKTPGELLPGVDVVYPVQPINPPPEYTAVFRCAGVHGYIVCPDSEPFYMIDSVCKTFGASPAIFETGAESEALRTWLPKLTHSVYWVPIQDDETEGTWLWSNGMPLTHTPWNPGEPNDHGKGEDCAGLNWEDEHKWLDVPCDIELGVLCELPSAGDTAGDTPTK